MGHPDLLTCVIPASNVQGATGIIFAVLVFLVIVFAILISFVVREIYAKSHKHVQLPKAHVQQPFIA